MAKNSDKVFDFKKFRDILTSVYGGTAISEFADDSKISYQTIHGLASGKTKKGPKKPTMAKILSTLRKQGIDLKGGDLFVYTNDPVEPEIKRSAPADQASDIIILELAKRLNQSESNNRLLSERVDQLEQENRILKMNLAKATNLK